MNVLRIQELQKEKQNMPAPAQYVSYFEENEAAKTWIFKIGK